MLSSVAVAVIVVAVLLLVGASVTLVLLLTLVSAHLAVWASALSTDVGHRRHLLIASHLVHQESEKA